MLVSRSPTDLTTTDIMIRTAVELAAYQAKDSTYANLAGIKDTLRLFYDSMDFSDRAGNGWSVLYKIVPYTSYSVHAGPPKAELGPRIALLLWTLKLSIGDLKMYPCKIHYWYLLSRTLLPNPGLEEASDLLLSLDGVEIIDSTLRSFSGHNILHEMIASSAGPECLLPMLSVGNIAYT